MSDGDFSEHDLVRTVTAGEWSKARQALAVVLAADIVERVHQEEQTGTIAPLAGQLRATLDDLEDRFMRISGEPDPAGDDGDEESPEVVDPLAAIAAAGATPISEGAKRKRDRRAAGDGARSARRSGA